MSSEIKISGLQQKINGKRESNFQKNLDGLLSLCESDIEKQLLLQIIFHLECRIEEALEMGEQAVSNSISFIDDVYNGNFIRGIEVDYGLEHNRETARRTLGVNSSGKTYFHTVRVYPQFEVVVNDASYRLDFAFYVEKRDLKDDSLHETRKIAIECDGYDYHKDPDKFKNDKKRERALKSVGWRDVVRYSGSEIYEISGDDKKMHYNFQEIMSIIMY